MNGHIVIFMYLIVFVFVSWVIFHLKNFYKIYQRSFLRSYIRYMIFFYLIISINFFIQYFATNFPNFSMDLNQSYFILYLNPLDIVISISSAFWFIKLVLQLQERGITSFEFRVFLSVTSLIVLCYIIGLTIYLSNSSFYFVSLVYRMTSLLSLLVCQFILIDMFLKFKSWKEIQYAKALIVFGLFYFVFYTVLLLHIHFPFGYHMFFINLSLLSTNSIFPLLWLKIFFKRYSMDPGKGEISQQIVDDIVDVYQISSREREILELIIQGKTNKEIEKILFLSFHTVKNHIYRLFQKVGVKSRGQLVNFVLRSKIKDE